MANTIQIPGLGGFGAQAGGVPDFLKPRPVSSYATPGLGSYNRQAFSLADMPANYVAAKHTSPATPPLTTTPGQIPGYLQEFLRRYPGGSWMFGGLGGINLQQLLAQYGGLLGNRQQVPPTPPRPAAQLYDPAQLQALIRGRLF